MTEHGAHPIGAREDSEARAHRRNDFNRVLGVTSWIPACAVYCIVHSLSSLFFNILTVNLSYIQSGLGADSGFAPVNDSVNAIPAAFLRGREVASDGGSYR